ncbi:MAG: hypothetical protein MMC23_003865 [Stictis urceolatum]|nr:hypothetical protein [Stictis urceolata]
METLAGYRRYKNGSMILMFMDNSRLWCDRAPTNISKTVYNHTKHDLYCTPDYWPPYSKSDRISSIIVGAIFGSIVLLSITILSVGVYRRNQELRRLAKRSFKGGAEFQPVTENVEMQLREFIAYKPPVERPLQQSSPSPTQSPTQLPPELANEPKAYEPKRYTPHDSSQTQARRSSPLASPQSSSTPVSEFHRGPTRLTSRLDLVPSTTPPLALQSVNSGVVELKGPPLPYPLQTRQSAEDAREGGMGG